MQARRMWVSGRVQGVAYRASTCEEARRLGLTGWTRNLADGRVEILAQGDEGAIEALAAWCRRGPPAARVAEVVVAEAPVDPTLHGFVVAR